ncbi:trigger factor [soil metagenome]
MQTRLIDKQAASARFEVTIPAQDVDKTFGAILNSVARQVKVPGFRPGKAPKSVLVQRVGQDALNQEVRDALVETNYPRAVKELDLTPVHAHFHADEPNEGSDYTFEVEVDLYPEFTLPDLKEIIIDSAAPPLTDDMVAEAVKDLQRENATLVPVDRAVEPGDYVLVETLRDGEESGSVLPIDLERVDAAFAEQLLGKAMGDVVELSLTSGNADDDEDFEDEEAMDEADADESDTEEAAATTAPELPKLTVLVKDVKEKEKPEADDELAKTLGFETWTEVEAKIRENIQRELESEAFQAQREEFIDKLIQETTLELPKSLVNRRKATLLSNLAQELQQNGVGLEAYLANLDETDKRSEFDTELQSAAELGVKRDMVLERLLDERGTTMSAKEFDDAVRYLAARENQDVSRFKREAGEEWLSNYRFALMRDKAVRETVRELLGQTDTDDEDAPEDETENGEENAPEEGDTDLETE